MQVKSGNAKSFSYCFMACNPLCHWLSSTFFSDARAQRDDNDAHLRADEDCFEDPKELASEGSYWAERSHLCTDDLGVNASIFEC